MTSLGASRKNGTSKGIKRVHSGCLTCKRRKVKCDENKPECERCRRGDHVCGGYDNVDIWSGPVSKKRASASMVAPASADGEHLPATLTDHALFRDVWVTRSDGSSRDSALPNASTDAVWEELMTAFTLLQDPIQTNVPCGETFVSSASISPIMGDVLESEEDLIISARSVYSKAVANMDTLAFEAFNRGLKWFPPAFSKSRRSMDDRFFCQLEKEPWSRVFLHLAGRSNLIRSFLVSIGTIYGPVLNAESHHFLQTGLSEMKNRGKQEYYKAVKNLRSMQIKIFALQQQSEWVTDDFYTAIEYIAGGILFMLYEELDRSLLEGDVDLWIHVVNFAVQMPELHCTHSYQESCALSTHYDPNTKRRSLCGKAEAREIDNFRILIRIMYWKDTLYRVIGQGAGPLTETNNLILSIRTWEAYDSYAQIRCLRSSSMSSSALWTPELLDIVACATRGSIDTDGDLLECLLCRIRMARLRSDLTEDDGLAIRRRMIFDMLRLTVQIYVRLMLDRHERVGEQDFFRIQCSLRLCHVATSGETIHSVWNEESSMIDTKDAFDHVQNCLHLHLAFPFLLAATHIESLESQEMLLSSLQRLSSNENGIRVADRGIDSIIFLRLLLKKIYRRSRMERIKSLKISIQTAIEDCRFPVNTQLLVT